MSALYGWNLSWWPPYWWIWPIAISPFIGSFLGVIVRRLERPRTIVVGRSACPDCGTRLGVRDLVPVLSFLASRGRCRHCAQPIGIFYPAIELGALGIAIWSASVAPDALTIWACCLLGWTLLTLAAIDFTYYLLPDFLTLPLIPAGLLVNWSIDDASLLPHVIGAVGGLLLVVGIRTIYKALRGREGIGLGDAKLLAAGGAWISWTGLPSVLLLGAVSALVFALFRRRRDGKLSGTDRVPFGAFLCLGLWITWLYGPLQIEEVPMRVGQLHLGLIGIVGASLLTPVPFALAAETPSVDSKQGCVDVQIGNERTPDFNCINRQLQQKVENEHRLKQIEAPIGPGSPSTTLGLANDAAARERMGTNFGKSAVPQRPVNVPSPPLLPGAAFGH